MIKLLVDEMLPHIDKATLILSGTPEACTLVIMSDAKKNGIKVQPINVSGTAEQVEAAVHDAIKAVFTDNKSLFTNFTEVAEDVKKQAAGGKKEAGKKEVAKSTVAETAPAAAPVEEIPVFKPAKEQKAIMKKAEEALAKAEKTDDLDMVNYLATQYENEYTKAKMPDNLITELKEKFNKIRESKGTPVTEAVSEAEGLFGEQAPATENKAAKTATAKPAATEAVAKEIKKETAVAEDDEVIF